MKIKKGDNVEITVGKDKGKRGMVIQAMPQEERVVVEGLNIVKRAKKPTRYGTKGQIVEMPQSLDVSNMQVVCPSCEKTSRVGYEIKGDQKERVCKKCEAKF